MSDSTLFGASAQTMLKYFTGSGGLAAHMPSFLRFYYLRADRLLHCTHPDHLPLHSEVLRQGRECRRREGISPLKSRLCRGSSP